MFETSARPDEINWHSDLVTVFHLRICGAGHVHYYLQVRIQRELMKNATVLMRI